MGQQLNAVFQKTLLGIENARGDKDTLGKLLDEELVADVLSLPGQDVPAEVRGFFETWKEKSEAISGRYQALIGDPEQADGESLDGLSRGRKYLDRVSILVNDLREFKVWVVTSAPDAIPNEFVVAAQIFLNRVIYEGAEALQYIQSIVELAESPSPAE